MSLSLLSRADRWLARRVARRAARRVARHRAEGWYIWNYCL